LLIENIENSFGLRRGPGRCSTISAGKIEGRALDHDTAWALIPPGGSFAKATIHTSTQSPTYLACARLITEAIASLPLTVFRREADGTKQRDGQHPLHRVLHDVANPWTSAYEQKLALTWDAIRHGSGYAHVIRAGGRVVELHRLRPTGVVVECDSTGEPHYRVTLANGGQLVLDYTEVVHLRPFSTGPLKDEVLSLTDDLAQAVGVEIAMLRHQAFIFTKAPRPGGILTSDKRLSPEAIANIKKVVEKFHAGEAAGGLMVLPAMKFLPQAFTSVDLQFNELQAAIVIAISRGFRVPPPLINDLSRATFSNAETMGRQFATYSLRPWCSAWEAALTRALLTPAEQAQTFVEFLLDDLTRADLAARYEAFSRAAGGAAWLTANEIRHVDNRAPLPDGDRLLRPSGATVAGDPPKGGADGA
jgi:HK97 family phage portal protein